ncbi:hypothetical protein GmHk_10G028549 [Glycine max]|uniref:Uncharacterized protein n=1 Tax=Glycine max TaxID=3847 RepID=A0A0R0I2Z9_SOYBN|nr:hypothetical protein GYH30_027607 [Glycine max]KAH1228570.1 hypothetical protein GmHk_10G028549 [Glycine max]
MFGSRLDILLRTTTNDHCCLSLHGYRDFFGLRFCKEIYQCPSHKFILCATFFVGEQYHAHCWACLAASAPPSCRFASTTFQECHAVHVHSQLNTPPQQPHARPFFQQEKFTHTMRDTSQMSVTLESSPFV